MAKVHILFVCFVFCCNIMPVTLIYCKFSPHSREILWNICLIYVQACWVFYRVICSWESILIVTSSVCVVQKFSLNYDAMLKNTWHHNNYLLTRSDNSVVYKYRINMGGQPHSQFCVCVWRLFLHWRYFSLHMVHSHAPTSLHNNT